MGLFGCMEPYECIPEPCFAVKKVLKMALEYAESSDSPITLNPIHNYNKTRKKSCKTCATVASLIGILLQLAACSQCRLGAAHFIASFKQARRDGGKARKVFPDPTTFGEPAIAQKY